MNQDEQVKSYDAGMSQVKAYDVGMSPSGPPGLGRRAETARRTTEAIGVQVVLRVDPEVEKKAAGGIIIPVTAQRRVDVWFATVVSAAPGRDVKAGDRVAVPRHLGFLVELDIGEDGKPEVFTVVKEEEILCKVSA